MMITDINLAFSSSNETNRDKVRKKKCEGFVNKMDRTHLGMKLLKYDASIINNATYNEANISEEVRVEK